MAKIEAGTAVREKTNNIRKHKEETGVLSTLEIKQNDITGPVLYGPKDIQKVFQMGKRQSYELMHEKGFPSFRCGKKLYVEHAKLMQWINRQTLK